MKRFASLLCAGFIGAALAGGMFYAIDSPTHASPLQADAAAETIIGDFVTVRYTKPINGRYAEPGRLLEISEHWVGVRADDATLWVNRDHIHYVKASHPGVQPEAEEAEQLIEVPKNPDQ